MAIWQIDKGYLCGCNPIILYTWYHKHSLYTHMWQWDKQYYVLYNVMKCTISKYYSKSFTLDYKNTHTVHVIRWAWG